ncbi:hypothetical protein CK203_100953 [Vitis vinifera]|uniref:Reverse transcriptase zinc-binding domain-containing protein n=1 Tax=Vitis vinifera TaxID=29760 RepID=A0A438D2F6_VITVI|nr:hypothetical protein CK203_100953 [Vitis vinifera]
MPKGHPQELSKPKGSSVSIRRIARSWPPRLEEAFSTPKRNLEGGGSSEANRDTFRGKSRSSKSDLSPGLKTSKAFTSETEGEEGISQCKLVNKVRPPFLAPFSSFPLESSFFVQRGSFFISPVVNISRRGGASCFEGFAPELEPSTLPLEGFQVEGLTPRKMAKVQSVLESLRIRIVRDNGKGVEGENKSALSADKETKREIWDKRFVSSVWKGRSLEWAALPASGASGGIVILWDLIKFKCTEKVLGSFSVTVKLNSDEEGSFWLTSVYGPNKPLWRKDFWLELQDLYGLTFPRWCVGGDFNVIRRISEKMGDSSFGKDLKKEGARGFVIRGRGSMETKSRVKWIKEGDYNSKFFHRVATGRRSRKFIKSLIFERGETLSNIEVIYEEIVNFFGNLIPNLKVLSGRLRKVLHETIFGSQGAFVEGRQILDAVLIANEVVDEKRRSCASKEGVQLEMEILDEGLVSEWPLSYLGLPLGGNPKTIGFWDPVVERISRRLDGWKKTYLSLGGRITLIQSCLSHIPSYFLSLFKILVSIASKIEKMQRDFLWSGGGREERSPYQMGGSLEKGAVFGIRLLRVYMGHILMDETPTRWLDGHTDVLGRLLLKVFQEFSPFVRLVVGNEERIRFWEDLWWGNQTLYSQFADLYRVISVKNLTVSNVLGNSLPVSWNFNFRRNLMDSEIDLLQRLMSSLNSVLFPLLHQIQDRGLYLLLSKVKALAWLVAHGKVNTNDKLQLRRPYKALCPQWCILCKGNGESIDHLFLHCLVTIGLWHRLGELIKRQDTLANCLPYFDLDGVAREKHRIFEDKGRTEEMVWDLIRFYSSLWASCTEAFRGVPLNILQLNWIGVCVSKV